jgi:hypothetical protein
MEHESFEDPEVAKILNDHFISIKVDREERPDLDQIYMTAVQMLTGQGGWPMSMFLAPDLKPFYGGTYFPPADNYGRPSFKRLLLAIADSWRDRREDIRQSAGQITEQLQARDRLESSGGVLDATLMQNPVGLLSRAFDRTYGGFGRAPKFPHSMNIRFLLRAWKRFGNDDALHMAQVTLDHMAMGGIYDHLGGGFHRYSTDERWLVPHFEKMLYDNALLTLAYLEAFQATQNGFYRDVVEETLAFILREMTGPEGAFYSTQDADSEGIEGKFFVWSVAEIESVLGKESADLFMDVYDVEKDGNWEGHNILARTKTYAQVARLRGMAEPELRRMLGEAKKKLLEVRSRRVWPGRDEKVLTAWNGLMIDALAQAALPLENPAYAQAASKAADFILRRMRTSDGRLFRTYFAGSEPKLNGYLEDYSFFLNALISLYEATFSHRWLESALELAGVMIDQFWDPAEGGFFYTGRDHEQLITRSKDPSDSSIPSGNAMAITALLRLAKLTGRTDLLEKAEFTLKLFHHLMVNDPLGAGQMLTALDFYLGPVEEFAIVGDLENAETRRVLRAIHRGFRPNKVEAFKNPNDGSKGAEEALPLLIQRSTLGPVTTYICRNYTCREPLVGAEAVEKVLL